MPEQSSNHLERKEKQSERVDLVLWGIMVVGADDLTIELEGGVPVVTVHGTGEAESSC